MLAPMRRLNASYSSGMRKNPEPYRFEARHSAALKVRHGVDGEPGIPAFAVEPEAPGRRLARQPRAERRGERGVVHRARDAEVDAERRLRFVRRTRLRHRHRHDRRHVSRGGGRGAWNLGARRRLRARTARERQDERDDRDGPTPTARQEGEERDSDDGAPARSTGRADVAAEDLVDLELALGRAAPRVRGGASGRIAEHGVEQRGGARHLLRAALRGIERELQHRRRGLRGEQAPRAAQVVGIVAAVHLGRVGRTVDRFVQVIVDLVDPVDDRRHLRAVGRPVGVGEAVLDGVNRLPDADVVGGQRHVDAVPERQVERQRDPRRRIGGPRRVEAVQRLVDVLEDEDAAVEERRRRPLRLGRVRVVEGMCRCCRFGSP